MNNDPSNDVMNRMFERAGLSTEPPVTPTTGAQTEPTPTPEAEGETVPTPETETEVMPTNPLQMSEAPVAPVENNTVPVAAPPENNAPVEEKKKKGSLLPLIIILIVLCIGGYFGYNYYVTNIKGNNTKDATAVIEDTEIEDEETDEEEVEDTEEKDATKEEKEDATTNDSGSTNNESTQPTNNNNNNSNSNSSAAPSGIEFTPGTVLYLYIDGGIGMDDVYFDYISHTDTQLVASVSINEGKATTYTFVLGQATKVNGIKNQVVAEYDSTEECFLMKFK